MQHKDTWMIASDETQRHSRTFNTFNDELHSAKVKSERFVKLEQAVKSSSQSRVFRFKMSTNTVSSSQLLQFFNTSTRNDEFAWVISENAFAESREETWLQSRLFCQAKYESHASRKNLHTFLQWHSCGMVKWGNMCRKMTSSKGRLNKLLHLRQPPYLLMSPRKGLETSNPSSPDLLQRILVPFPLSPYRKCGFRPRTFLKRENHLSRLCLCQPIWRMFRMNWA